VITLILVLAATKRPAQGQEFRPRAAAAADSLNTQSIVPDDDAGAHPNGSQAEIWTEAATFIGESGIYGAYGHAVDIGGDTAVVGDLSLWVNGLAHAGGVYVYERDSIDGHWFQRTVLHAPTAQ